MFNEQTQSEQTLEEMLERIEDPELEALGVPVYSLSTELFFDYIDSKNPHSNDGETWSAACKAGESRSVKTNQWLEKKGMSVAYADPTTVRTAYGMDQIGLMPRIIGGDFDPETGMLTPEGFKNDKGFNRLILYVGTKDNTDKLRRLLGNSLKRLAQIKQIDAFNGLEVFIIPDDDIGGIAKLIQSHSRS